jgi:hypothetical protein
MNSFLKSFLIISVLFVSSTGCNNKVDDKKTATSDTAETITPAKPSTFVGEKTTIAKNEPTDFIPEGYIMFEKINGDLNNDGAEDCVLIIKGTNKNKIITDEYRGRLDQNRRGIIVLFNNNGSYELATKNYDCFSSENEDGGVYFAPELSLDIKRGNLYINYGHGRYGAWKYTFKYQNGDFKLIGYDFFEGAPVVESETSINFLTKKKQVKVNVNESAEGGDEIYEENWSTIRIGQLISLDGVRDFDVLDMNRY